MLSEKLDERVKKYLEEKKKKEEEERRREEKIKLDTILNEAQRIWKQLSERLENFDDSQLVEGVKLDVIMKGVYPKKDYLVTTRFEIEVKYFNETLEKVMELAEAEGIKAKELDSKEAYIFEYKPNIKTD